MTKKHTKESINERIKHRNIELIGEYKDSRSKSTFRCANGHEWDTMASHVISPKSTTGCPQCYKLNVYHTKDSINNLIKSRGITLIGEYKNARSRATFECTVGHTWMTTPASILHGTGCFECHLNSIRHTKESINELIISRGIKLLSHTPTSGSILDEIGTFMCDLGHIWDTTVEHVRGGDGCPGCPKCSIGGGFKSNKSGTVYILHYTELKSIKYGITNNFENRFQQLSKQSECKLLHKLEFENGGDAFLIEKSIKKYFGGKYSTKEELPDGYTETLPESMKDELLAILKAA